MANQNNPYRAHMKHSPRGIFNVYSINSVYTSDLSGREFANVNVAKIYPLSCPVADDMRPIIIIPLLFSPSRYVRTHKAPNYRGHSSHPVLRCYTNLTPESSLLGAYHDFIERASGGAGGG